MPPYNSPQSPLIPTRSPFRIRDSQIAKIQNGNGDRFSLGIEVGNIWSMKPIDHIEKDQFQNYNMFSSSHLLAQLLISQAILDSNDFKMLTFENLDKLKKEVVEINDRIKNISNSIELENRIVKISRSLENKNFKNSRHSVLYLQNQRQHNEYKIKYKIDQLEFFKKREIEIKKALLEHNASVLNKGIQQLEQTKLKSSNSEHNLLNNLEAELNQVYQKVDQITIYQLKLIPSNSNLNIHQKLFEIDQFLSNNQLNKINRNDEFKLQQSNIIQMTKTELISKLIDMELLSNKLLNIVNQYPKRQLALQIECLQYQTESTELKIWQKTKEKQDQVQKEIELKDGNRDRIAIQNKFKKLLTDQSTQFEAKLEEQNFEIQKKKKTCESLSLDCNQLVEKRNQLDQLIKDKSRQIDTQDNKISQLTYEIRELQRKPKQAPAQFNKDLEREKQKLKAVLDKRESDWTSHHAMVEDSFDEIMDNFDTLTNEAIEFESHRMRYDKRIDDLHKTIQQLEMELIEEKVKKIGYNNTNEPPTTASLRKEFRALVADLKRVQQQRMDQEANEMQRLQAQLEELQYSNNPKYKNQQSMSTQTD